MGVQVNEVLAGPGNFGALRDTGDIRYLVIHYTGNDGDTAAANAQYYRDTVVRASAHYFVDDTSVYRSVPENRTAWAVGGKRWADCARTGGGTLYGTVTNTNSISVELCDTRKDGVYGASEQTIQNATALCREIMARYGIPVERVVRHFDVTGKHCPAYMMDPAAWSAFKARLMGEGMDNAPSPAHREGVEWCMENRILRGNADGDLMLHQGVTREEYCTMNKRTVDWLMERFMKRE